MVHGVDKVSNPPPHGIAAVKVWNWFVIERMPLSGNSTPMKERGVPLRSEGRTPRRV